MSQTVSSFRDTVKEPAQSAPKVRADPFTSSLLYKAVHRQQLLFSMPWSIASPIHSECQHWKNTAYFKILLSLRGIFPVSCSAYIIQRTRRLGEVSAVRQSPVWVTNPLSWHHRNRNSCSAVPLSWHHRSCYSCSAAKKDFRQFFSLSAAWVRPIEGKQMPETKSQALSFQSTMIQLYQYNLMIISWRHDGRILAIRHQWTFYDFHVSPLSGTVDEKGEDVLKTESLQTYVLLCHLIIAVHTRWSHKQNVDTNSSKL